MLQSRVEVEIEDAFIIYLLVGTEAVPKDAAQSRSAPLGHKEANRFLTTKALFKSQCSKSSALPTLQTLHMRTCYKHRSSHMGGKELSGK